MTLDLLRLIQTSPSSTTLACSAAAFFRTESGVEAAGIRLSNGLEHRYFESHGGDFLTIENNLCWQRGESDRPPDESGETPQDCLCDAIIGGRFDAGQPYCTARGSFWTNNASELAPKLSSGLLPSALGRRCLGTGYESVALIPLAVGAERLGLLQLNDSRRDVFTAEGIAIWEELADYLAVAISRLRAEEEKGRTKEHYRYLFESASDMVILLDRTGKVLDINQAGCDFVGYSRDELLRMNAAQLHAQEASNTFQATFDRIMSNGRAVFATLVRRKQGDLIPVEISGRLIEAAGSRQVFCIVRDLRERLQAEEELREQQERLNRFFSLDAGLLSISDQTGHFVMLSAGWEKVLGYSIQELTARPYMDFVHPDDAEAVAEAAGQLAQQQELSEFTNRFIAKDGTVHWIEWRSAPAGKLIYGTARDVTEKRAADEELLRLNRMLVALNQANAALVRADDEQALLLEMCEIAVNAGGYDLAWVGFRQEGETMALHPVAWAGDATGYLDTAGFSWTDEQYLLPAPLALRTGQTQVIDDVESSGLQFPRRESLHRLGIRSVIALPLKDRGQVFGILAVDAKRPAAFTPSEVFLLEELASALSYGIASLRLEKGRQQAEDDRHRAEADLRLTLEQQERGLEQTVMALASALESRDVYTAGHQKRVAELAEAIAIQMGLPDERVRGIYLAANLHDIGKIQVPAQILSKPGALTDVEMAIIRTHAEAGYQILKNIEFPWPIAQMVLQHHERLDGTGYPNRLREKEICLEARILAVADAVEARTSHRPYRPARDEEAMWNDLIGQFAGEFDQTVVAACRAVWPALHQRQKQVVDGVDHYRA